MWYSVYSNNLSTGKEEKGSIERQRELLYSYIDSSRELVGSVKEYIDEEIRGIAGESPDRPGFRALIEDAKKGVIQTIYGQKLSRTQRSARREKCEEGTGIPGFAPFGYVKDPEQPGRWKVDPEAGKVASYLKRKP